jgi:hypothetical protein
MRQESDIGDFHDDVLSYLAAIAHPVIPSMQPSSHQPSSTLSEGRRVPIADWLLNLPLLTSTPEGLRDILATCTSVQIYCALLRPV